MTAAMTGHAHRKGVQRLDFAIWNFFPYQEQQPLQGRWHGVKTPLIQWEKSVTMSPIFLIFTTCK
jgi:hypothetical protein